MAFLHRPLVPEGRAARVLPCEGAVPCPEASRPWVLFVTILASAMAFIDGSVVTIAIPVMQRELGAGLAALQWVVNGYTLFLGALILVGGAAGDRFGRLRLFLLRHRRLRAGLARLRAGARGRGADRGAAGAGDRRGDDGAAEPRDHLGGVPARAARSGRSAPGPGRARSAPRSGRRSAASSSTRSAGRRRSGSTCRWRWWWWCSPAPTCRRAGRRRPGRSTGRAGCSPWRRRRWSRSG